MYKILRESEARARVVERGSMLGESELCRNRASFLISLLCVLIMRKNCYCNDDGHFVLRSLEAFPYSFHRQQAMYANDYAGPSTTAKDLGGHQQQG